MHWAMICWATFGSGIRVHVTLTRSTFLNTPNFPDLIVYLIEYLWDVLDKVRFMVAPPCKI